MSAPARASRSRDEASAGVPSGAPSRIRGTLQLSSFASGCTIVVPAAYDRRVTSGALTDRESTGSADAAAPDSPATGVASVPEAVRRRLLPRVGRDPMSWLPTLAVVLLAAGVPAVWGGDPRRERFR